MSTDKRGFDYWFGVPEGEISFFDYTTGWVRSNPYMNTVERRKYWDYVLNWMI